MGEVLVKAGDVCSGEEGRRHDIQVIGIIIFQVDIELRQIFIYIINNRPYV